MNKRYDYFPKEFLEVSVEYNLFKLNRNPRIIYLIILFFISGALISLPFIYIDIVVYANGNIAALDKETDLSVLVSGRVQHSNISENKYVYSGDTLLTLDTQYQIKEARQLKSRLVLVESDLLDISKFEKKIGHTDRPKFNTPKYEAEYNKYRNERQKKINIVLEKKIILDRQLKLYNSQTISQSEYQRDSISYVFAINELDIYESKLLVDLRQLYAKLEYEKNELLLKIESINESINNSTVVAPQTGWLIDCQILRKNQYIISGENIAKIASDTSLVAILLIPNSKIARINIGQKVKIMIDAYDPYKWGFLNGSVLEISENTYFNGNISYFKVRCQLDKEVVSLDNGIEGRIKAGMTIQGNFLITRRNLYQLLFDKVTDWLNPNFKQK